MSTAPKDTNFLHKYSLTIRGELISFDKALIMGILNLTPDSFFDGGQFKSEKEMMDKVSSMIKEGADIIDIGAYSSRPGAENISLEEELSRLLSPLKTIRKEFPTILLSIDTFRSTIAKQVVDYGADIINDISAGLLDENMLNTVGEMKVPYIMMHMKGNPQNMQENPSYENVTNEVYQFFSSQIRKAVLAGNKDIIIDPGFGFGKNIDDNYRLMRNLKEFASFNYPLLAGVSRKSMVSKIIGQPSQEALNGTIALNTIALLNGANILRVHDVKAAKDAIEVVSYYQNA